MEEPELDCPDQAIDTELPDGEFVDMETWEAMRDEAESEGDAE